MFSESGSSGFGALRRAWILFSTRALENQKVSIINISGYNVLGLVEREREGESVWNIYTSRAQFLSVAQDSICLSECQGRSFQAIHTYIRAIRQMFHKDI